MARDAYLLRRRRSRRRRTPAGEVQARLPSLSVVERGLKVYEEGPNREINMMHAQPKMARRLPPPTELRASLIG